MLSKTGCRTKRSNRLEQKRPPSTSNFVKRRFKRPMKTKKIPRMRRLTLHLILLRYSDQDESQIGNFQSFTHNPHGFSSSHENY